jgi:hypothetical protein
MRRSWIWFCASLCLALSITTAKGQEQAPRTLAPGEDRGIVEPGDADAAANHDEVPAARCGDCPGRSRILVPAHNVCSEPILQNNPGIGCPAHATHGSGLQIFFNWTDARAQHGIEGYSIVVKHVNATIPLIDTFVPVSELTYRNCNAFVGDEFLDGWEWTVRAKDTLGNLGPWSRTGVFSFQPCRLADGTPCRP